MQYVLPQIAAISIGSNCGAFNASQGASGTGFVLLGGEKGSLFFSLVHVVSTAAPEKERIKCHFVLLGGRKSLLFFHWPPLFLTDTSRL